MRGLGTIINALGIVIQNFPEGFSLMMVLDVALG